MCVCAGGGGGGVREATGAEGEKSISLGAAGFITC